MQGSEIRTQPLVSLALPVYNGGAFVAETISSILAQEYRDFELIITDNDSTDATGLICQRFAAADERIRYVRNANNLGAGPNHNLGFGLSRGTYFKWCAADDKISPNFVSACVKALEQNPDAVLAYGTTQCIDPHGDEIPLIGRDMTEHNSNDNPAQRFYKDLIDRGTCTNFQAFALIRSNCLRKTDLHLSYYGSDQTLISELALLGRFVHVPEAILYNREHPNRSMNIQARRSTHQWQNTSSRKKPLPTNAYRLQHIIRIAIRHREVVPLRKMIPLIFAWISEKAMDRARVSFRQLKGRKMDKASA